MRLADVMEGKTVDKVEATGASYVVTMSDGVQVCFTGIYASETVTAKVRLPGQWQDAD